MFGLRKLFGLGGGANRIDAAKARELILGANAMVVDVREPSEVRASGKIAGAINVPSGAIGDHADPAAGHRDWSFEPNRPIIVYCASGMRSARACATLERLGYTQVYDLGGFGSWVAAGGDTERA
jgi:rhodanese-related sulfurtransferase